RWFTDRFRAAHPDVPARLSDVFVANDVECYSASCAMLGAFDLRAAAETIRTPTAVIVGKQDFATPPAMSQDLHERITGSSLEVLPARHLTPVELPDEVAGALRNLIAS